MHRGRRSLRPGGESPGVTHERCSGRRSSTRDVFRVETHWNSRWRCHSFRPQSDMASEPACSASRSGTDRDLAVPQFSRCLGSYPPPFASGSRLAHSGVSALMRREVPDRLRWGQMAWLGRDEREGCKMAQCRKEFSAAFRRGARRGRDRCARAQHHREEQANDSMCSKRAT